MSYIMGNLIAGLILILILCGAIAYIVKAKKKGVKCIGCPAAGQCSSSQAGETAEAGCGSCCGCSRCEEGMKC